MDRLNITGALIPEHSRRARGEGNKRGGGDGGKGGGKEIDTRNDTGLCRGQEGVERPLQGTNLSCRAQLVPEVPRIPHGDGGHRA